MKKFFLTTIICLFTIGIANAQAYNGSGDQKVSIGLTPWGYGTGVTGMYDYGLTELFSVGGGAEIYFDNGDNNDSFYIFGRANIHLGEMINLPSNMDFYPGLDIGFRKGFGLGAHLGFRYLFTDKIGAYIEAGSRGSLGVVINL